LGEFCACLIDEVDEQSAYLRKAVEKIKRSEEQQRLRYRRRYLEQHYQELSAQTGEGNDGEIEDLEELEDDDSKPESAGKLGERIE